MHIVLVSQEFPPDKHGGIGSQTKAKAHALVARGHAATVITQNGRDERSELNDEGVRVIRVPGFDKRLPLYTQPAQWLMHSVRVAEELADLHTRFSVDLIDFAEWAAEGYAFFINRTPYNYVPAVVQLHGPLVMFSHTMNWPEPNSDFYRIGTHMEGTCIHLADAVYSSSRCSIEWCARYYGLVEIDVPVIHTGVDTDRFQANDAKREKRPTIVFVGKLVENKGVLDLAVAASRLIAEFPDLQVWMFGNGEPSIIERLNNVRSRFPDADFLQLKGFAQREMLPEILARAHIFAAPSIYEGGPGFVYLEAMSAGLPVIACSGSGAAEVVTHEQTGMLVSPGDVDELTTHLQALLADAPLREQMGRRARDWVMAEAESDKCLERLVGFYQSVVNQHQSKVVKC